METKRQALHRLVDALPDDSLQSAEQALQYCAHRGERQFTLEYAQRRVREMSAKHTPRNNEQSGVPSLSATLANGMTKPNGDFRGSMTGWDGQRPVTYHLFVFRGHKFEIFEHLEMANDDTELMFTQRFVGPTGSEQVMTASMPVSNREK